MKFRAPGKSFTIGDHAKLRAMQRFGWDFPKLKHDARKALEDGDQFKEFKLYDGRLFLFKKRKGKGTLHLLTVMTVDEAAKTDVVL